MTKWPHRYRYITRIQGPVSSLASLWTQMLGGQCNQESCAAGGGEASRTHLVVRGAVLVAHGDSGCPGSLRRVSEQLEKNERA